MLSILQVLCKQRDPFSLLIRLVCTRHLLRWRRLTVAALLVADADIKVLEPEWLREKLITAARRVLKNNEE